MNKERSVRKTVIQSLPGFWGYMALSTALFLLIQLIALVPSILMQQVIDRFIPNKQIDKIVLYIILFCALPLLAAIMYRSLHYSVLCLAVACCHYDHGLSLWFGDYLSKTGLEIGDSRF